MEDVFCVFFIFYFFYSARAEHAGAAREPGRNRLLTHSMFHIRDKSYFMSFYQEDGQDGVWVCAELVRPQAKNTFMCHDWGCSSTPIASMSAASAGLKTHSVCLQGHVLYKPDGSHGPRVADLEGGSMWQELELENRPRQTWILVCYIDLLEAFTSGNGWRMCQSLSLFPMFLTCDQFINPLSQHVFIFTAVAVSGVPLRPWCSATMRIIISRPFALKALQPCFYR